jgi:hypothetical protein
MSNSNREHGSLSVFSDSIMNADLSSKLSQVIEQIPKDVLYDFLCSYAQEHEELAMAFSNIPSPLRLRRGSTSPCIPSPQAREKLTTTETLCVKVLVKFTKPVPFG